MFICRRCHNKNEKHDYDSHFAWSYGPCEVCRLVRECVDCRER